MTDKKYSVASVPTLAINTSNIADEQSLSVTLRVTSTAPYNSSVMDFVFTVQIIDNPCVGGFEGIPANNAWDTTMSAHIPKIIDFAGINNG